MSTASAHNTIDANDETPVLTTVFDLVSAIQEAADEESDSEEEADMLACAALLGMREQIVLAGEDDVAQAA